MKTPSRSSRLRRPAFVAAVLLAAVTVRGDTNPQALPFAQDWTNTGLITTSNDWSGVPGVIGYRGDDLTLATGTDPQTILVDGTSTPVNVVANANPTINTGGVLEVDTTIANPTIAIQGSGTADAPFLLLTLNTSGLTGITVSYNLRDLDASADNAVQQVALHFRVGTSGDFTNVPAGYVADATTANTATQVTPVAAVLPASADSQPVVQVRIMTTNAASFDELTGVDDIQVTGTPIGGTPNLTVNDVTVNEGNGGTVIAQFTVSLSSPAGPGGVTFDVGTADGTATTADNDYLALSLVGQTIAAGNTSATFNVTVNGDITVEPNETFFLNVTNVTNANVVDGQGLGTITNDDFVITAIHDIQGSGSASPLVGQPVTTIGVVTGLKSNGFFIQAPDADADAEPGTSEGVFVFTSAAPPPAAAIGNEVRVGGTVVEFIPNADPDSPPMTEISGPTVAFLSAGNPLPGAIVLTTADTNPAGPIDQLERLEGMRVSVASLTVVHPTGGSITSVTEPNATSTTTGVFYGVLPAIARPFREAGIELPDPLPPGSPCCVPRFDANPERLRVDSDAQPGAMPIEVTTGATVTGLVGPLDYGFRTYTIVPDAATVPGVSANVSATPVPAPTTEEFTVASFNLMRFFDDLPNGPGPTLTITAFNNRLNKASLAIRNVLRTPDVIGVQEAENIGALTALANKVNADAMTAGDPNPLYTAHLSEGNDIGGIDVGFLVKSSRVNVVSVTQEGLAATYLDPSTDPPTPALLNDRPPLVLEAEVQAPAGPPVAVTVIVNHLRSLSRVDDPVDGGRVRAKRRAQAEFLADLIQDRQALDPAERIVSVGDYNAFQVNDGYVDSIATIKGTPTPAANVVLASADLVDPDLRNLVEQLPASERYSYVFDGNAQVLDHVIVNGDAGALFTRFHHARLDADFPESFRNDPNRPERLSDHDAPVAYFAFAPTGVLGQMYYTVAPCRVVDTRGGAPIAGPVLQGQETRTLAVTGHCGIPASAKAVSINLAVTQPGAAGNVRLFPAGQAVPTVSSINYRAGQTRGNNAIVPLDASGAMAAFVGQPAVTTVHVIIDVNGYFE